MAGRLSYAVENVVAENRTEVCQVYFHRRRRCAAPRRRRRRYSLVTQGEQQQLERNVAASRLALGASRFAAVDRFALSDSRHQKASPKTT